MILAKTMRSTSGRPSRVGRVYSHLARVALVGLASLCDPNMVFVSRRRGCRWANQFDHTVALVLFVRRYFVARPFFAYLAILE